jgi:hypothetical protein
VIPDNTRASILECFRPSIPALDESIVLAEVEGLVSDLREAAAMIGPDGRLLFCPIARIGETDEGYIARCHEALTRPIEGRPPDRLLLVLTAWCRDLLIKHGCRAGVPKDEEKACGLTDLIRVVNDLAGRPVGIWSEVALRRAAAADRASSLVNQLEFRVGHPLQLVQFKDGVPGEPEPLQGEARKQAEAMLREAEVKPPKHPRPHGQKKP